MYAHARMYALLFVSVYACAACACFFSSSVCVRMKKKKYMWPIWIEILLVCCYCQCAFLFVWCNAALWYRFYLTSKKKLCHARCTYFVFVFTSTCIGRKKIKILHVAKPYRNGSFVGVTNMLPWAHARANVNRADLNWNGLLSFLSKCFPEHTNVKCVGNILYRAKMEDVRGCADGCAFCLYAYMHALRARVYVCVQYMRNKKTSLAAF